METGTKTRVGDGYTRGVGWNSCLGGHIHPTPRSAGGCSFLVFSSRGIVPFSISVSLNEYKEFLMFLSRGSAFSLSIIITASNHSKYLTWGMLITSQFGVAAAQKKKQSSLLHSPAGS